MDKKITILVDNDSWILPYANKLCDELIHLGFVAKVVREHKSIEEGWVNFMLGCVNITPVNILQRSQHNLVVHESDLPKGKGFSPMTWQIIEGKNEIPICLIEASEKVDEGDIWIQDSISLNGSELCEQWRAMQGEKTIELCLRFVKEHNEMVPKKQVGESSFYNRRGPEDSELNISKSIQEQFNLLRVVDNENYPGYFYINNTKYLLKIEKA